MELNNFKSNEILDSELESIVGGIEIFGEDTGFIVEEDGGFLVEIVTEDGDF